MLVKHVGDTARHTSSEVATSAAKAEHTTACHVLATVITHTLNNGGDTVALQKPGGAVVDAYTYAASLAGQDGVSMNRSPDGSATGSFALHTSVSTRSASPGTRANGTAF